MTSTNDFFSNMFRTFGFPANPFLAGAGSEASAATATAPGVRNMQAPPTGAANLQEMVRQQLESQIKLFSALTTCTLASTEKLIELNMNAARTSVQENSTLANQVLASQSTNDLQVILTALPQATSTKAVAYGHHLTSIAADACTEIARSTQSEVAEMTDRLCSLIDQASRNLPAGPANMAALTKAVMTTANSGYEQVVKTAEQAAHTIEENAEHIVNNAVETTARTTGGNGSRRHH
ncbi:MAG TPA: phasin family protein [Noviherbaspirillum sp.]